MLFLIPLLPFAGFLLNASFGRKLAKPVSGAIACAAVIASFLTSLAAVVMLVGLAPEERAIAEHAFNWITSGAYNVPMDLRLDPLSALMILVVTGIGSLIH